MRKILFGANIPQAGTDYEVMKRVVVECEKYGFDFMWISDHLQDFSLTKSYFECWTTLSALVASTTRIRFCTILLNNLFRSPSLLAKMGATLDVISNGRLEFGIGAGWYEEECQSNGIQFPAPPERIQRLKEAIEIIKELWTKDKVSFNGRYYTLKDAVSYPKPIQKPHPPIWTGIMYGKRRMLKLIAKYADTWTISSLYLPTPDEYRQLREALDARCHEIGRDPNQLRGALGIGCVIAEDEKTLREKVRKFKPTTISVRNYSARQMRLEGTPEQLIEKLRLYADQGVTTFVMNFPDISTFEPIRLFSEKVMPAIR